MSGLACSGLLGARESKQINKGRVSDGVISSTRARAREHGHPPSKDSILGNHYCLELQHDDFGSRKQAALHAKAQALSRDMLTRRSGQGADSKRLGHAGSLVHGERPQSAALSHLLSGHSTHSAAHPPPPLAASRGAAPDQRPGTAVGGRGGRGEHVGGGMGREELRPCSAVYGGSFRDVGGGRFGFGMWRDTGAGSGHGGREWRSEAGSRMRYAPVRVSRAR